MKRILALAATFVALGVAGVLAQSGGGGTFAQSSGATTNVEVRVWQRVNDDQALLHQRAARRRELAHAGHDSAGTW